MTSTSDPLSLDGADDPAAMLAYARAQKQVEDDAAREVFKAAAAYAAMHSSDSLVGPIDQWHESGLPLGGEGCPEVAEFAVVEFAAAMGRSTESGRRYLSKAVEGCYRLPWCWARLEAGDLAAWKLGFIAERTLCLSPQAAGFVDAMVAAFAHTIGPAQLGQLRSRRPSPGSTPRRPRPTGWPPLIPGGWTSTSPRSPQRRARCTPQASWTWPTRSTSTPRWLLMPTNSCWPARPRPWTYAAPSRPATWPATKPPSTSPPTSPSTGPGSRGR